MPQAPHHTGHNSTAAVHEAPAGAHPFLPAANICIPAWPALHLAPPVSPLPIPPQSTGSLLLASTEAESAALAERQLSLNGHAVRATFLDRTRLGDVEPALHLPRGGGALLVQSDAQIVSACGGAGA